MAEMNAEYIRLRRAEADAPKKKKKRVGFGTQYGNVTVPGETHTTTPDVSEVPIKPMTFWELEEKKDTELK